MPPPQRTQRKKDAGPSWCLRSSWAGQNRSPANRPPCPGGVVRAEEVWQPAKQSGDLLGKGGCGLCALGGLAPPHPPARRPQAAGLSSSGAAASRESSVSPWTPAPSWREESTGASPRRLRAAQAARNSPDRLPPPPSKSLPQKPSPGGRSGRGSEAQRSQQLPWRGRTTLPPAPLCPGICLEGGG